VLTCVLVSAMLLAAAYGIWLLYGCVSKNPSLFGVQPLPCTGTIRSFSNTGSANGSYWCIQLDDVYGQQSEDIARRCDSFLQRNHRDEYQLAQTVCRSWADLVHRSNAIIQCVNPPSLAGLHISLGTWDNDENLPECLKEGASVSFAVKTIKVQPSMRTAPQNLPGQFTDSEGMRFYPTLWVLAQIDFIDFVSPTGVYPPHISLACVAVQLEEDEVGAATIRATT